MAHDITKPIDASAVEPNNNTLKYPNDVAALEARCKKLEEAVEELQTIVAALP